MHVQSELSIGEEQLASDMLASQNSKARSSNLKVALIHDWLTGMRGGEKALETICSLFPDAPLWTLVHVPGSVSKTIESRKIHTSFLQHMPFVKTKYRSYLPLFPLAAETTQVSANDADVVISTSHAVAKAMVRKNDQSRPLHVCYLHTPMRYIWDRFDDYFGPEQVGHIASRLFFKPIAKLLQIYDLSTVNRVDVYCTNSRYVANLIRKIYGRTAEVIYGPGDEGKGAQVVRFPEDWYLMVTALVPYKRIDQAIEACAKLGRKLKIIGKGPEEKSLKLYAKRMKVSVEFLGFVSDNELLNNYARAKALIFPGVEDFGLVPVEAIAAGCPVIALAKGGVLDSMTPDTAEFYEEESATALQQAILRFETRKFTDLTLRRRAAEFTRERFSRRLEAVLHSAMSSHRPAEPAVARCRSDRKQTIVSFATNHTAMKEESPPTRAAEHFSDCSALLLVGGLGMRLRSAYADGPKALAPIAGKPFLTYLLESLAAASVERVVLCVGYRAEQIEGWLSDGEKFGLRISYSREAEPMGTAGALGLAYERFARGQRVLAMNGDSILKVSLPAMWDWHRKHAASATIALAALDDTSRYGQVEVNTRGWVTSFREKNGGGNAGLINGGVYLFEPSVMEHVVATGATSLEKEVLPALIEKGLLAYKTDGYFIDIGVPDDFFRAQSELVAAVRTFA